MQLDSAGVVPHIGLHEPDVQEPPPLTPSAIATVIHNPMDVGTSYTDQISFPDNWCAGTLIMHFISE